MAKISMMLLAVVSTVVAVAQAEQNLRGEPSEMPADQEAKTSSSHEIISSADCNCDWIANDKCEARDHCAVNCRRMNPWGPCSEVDNEDGRQVVSSQQCDCSGIKEDQCITRDDCSMKCRKLNPWGPCKISQIDNRIIHSEDCGCDWIYHDSCSSTDHCSTRCREMNPWGPCGASSHSEDAVGQVFAEVESEDLDSVSSSIVLDFNELNFTNDELLGLVAKPCSACKGCRRCAGCRGCLGRESDPKCIQSCSSCLPCKSCAHCLR